jgi:transcriptional regulator GlxA family with amidase domain
MAGHGSGDTLIGCLLVLSTISDMAMRIAFLFYDGMTTLDAIGPWEVLSRLPGAQPVVASRYGARVKTDTGLVFDDTVPLAAVTAADVLVVPGAGDVRPQLSDQRTLAWVRAIDATTRWTTSVCTGALILGAAGLLKDKRATTHWAALKSLRQFGATPANERVVRDGKVITAAGVSAGIDMALTLAAELTDEATARGMQLVIEYDPQPPFDSGGVGSVDEATKAKALELLAVGVKR